MGPSSTLRQGPWKLIYYHLDQRFELFDLVDDLSETRNRAAHEPQRVREMARALSAILRRHRAPMPIVKQTGKPIPLPDETAPGQ